MAEIPITNLALSHILSGRNTSISLSLVVGIIPVPNETTSDNGRISVSLPLLLKAKLYSWISVIASSVGLFAIKPPSKKRPNALKIIIY